MKGATLMMAVLALLLGSVGQANANVTLDFTSGTFSSELGGNSDTYNQSGFKLQVVSAGNHTDPGFLGPLGFHNGTFPVADNDLILTFSGRAFDFNGLNIAGFSDATSIELLASTGATASFSSTGFHATPSFTNVTFARFSIPFSGFGVGFNSMSVDTSPTVAAVPAPSSLALFGMATATLAGYFGWRRRKQPVTA